jgi:hypothetical protein
MEPVGGMPVLADENQRRATWAATMVCARAKTCTMIFPAPRRRREARNAEAAARNDRAITRNATM